MKMKKININEAKGNNSLQYVKNHWLHGLFIFYLLIGQPPQITD